jgi:hypothetical protein
VCVLARADGSADFDPLLHLLLLSRTASFLSSNGMAELAAVKAAMQVDLRKAETLLASLKARLTPAWAPAPQSGSRTSHARASFCLRSRVALQVQLTAFASLPPLCEESATAASELALARARPARRLALSWL